MAENSSNTPNQQQQEEGEDITINVEAVGGSSNQEADNVKILKKARKDAFKAQQHLEEVLQGLAKETPKKKKKQDKGDKEASSSSSSSSSSDSSDEACGRKHKKGRKSRSPWEKHGHFRHHPFGFGFGMMPMPPHCGGPHHRGPQHGGPHHRGPHHGGHHGGPHHRGLHHLGHDRHHHHHHHGPSPGAQERFEFLRQFGHHFHRGNLGENGPWARHRGRGFPGHGRNPWRHFEGDALSRRTCGGTDDELNELLRSCWPRGDFPGCHRARANSCPRS